MYFKTVILLVNIQFISLPKVIKKMKSAPPQNHFLWKTSYFENFTMYKKMQEFFFEDRIYPNISENKNENQTSCLGVESRIVKKGVFPQNAKTMSYD